MKRISNRNHSKQRGMSSGPQVQFIERIVEVPVEQQAAPSSVVEVEKIVEIPVERIVEIERIVERQAVATDLSAVHSHMKKHEELAKYNNKFLQQTMSEMEMQRRALVAIKQQRDIDRDRRLMLIRRLRKEQSAHKKTELKMKLAISASLILSIITLIIK